MSDNVIGIIGGTIGIGQYIINDYVITITESDGEYGYTMTIARGDEVQTISLYGLTPEQYNSMIGYLEQAQAAAQAAGESESQASAFMDVALDAANLANTQASRASGFANTAQSYAWQAQQSETAAESAKDAAVAAKNDAQKAATSAASSRDAAQTAATEAGTAKVAAETAQSAAEAAQTAAQAAETNTHTYAGQAFQSAASAAQTLAQVQAEGQTQIAAIDAEGQRVLDSIPEDYMTLQSQVWDAYPTEHVDGSLASFSDGANDLPVKALTVDVMLTQAGSGDPSPSNVRTITGRTGMTITRRGKNIFDQSAMKDQAGWNIIKVYIPAGTQVIMSSNQPSGLGLLVYFRQGGSSTQPSWTNVYSGHPVLQTVPDLGYVEVVQRRTSGEDSFANYQYQIEVGNTATAYTPYVSMDYAIDWSDAAGTVYGGTLDVLTGVLTVDSVKLSKTFSELSTSSGDVPEGYVMKSFGILSSLVDVSRGSSAACNVAVYSTISNAPNVFRFTSNGQYCYVTLPDTTSADTVVEIVYPVVSKQTYQLDPVDVRTLRGDNTLWADCGDVAVTYRADPTLYATKGQTDDDMTADSAIASGAYFQIGSTLYKATAAIATGETIVPGTNCTVTTIAEALNLLNA